MINEEEYRNLVSRFQRAEKRIIKLENTVETLLIHEKALRERIKELKKKCV